MKKIYLMMGEPNNFPGTTLAELQYSNAQTASQQAWLCEKSSLNSLMISCILSSNNFADDDLVSREAIVESAKYCCASSASNFHIPFFFLSQHVPFAVSETGRYHLL
jgi:hypothetical protein